MIDNEIIKALECCANCNGSDCEDCPCQTMSLNCEGVDLQALDLINRQKAEIERLNKELNKQQIKNNMLWETAKEIIETFNEESASKRMSDDYNFEVGM